LIGRKGWDDKAPWQPKEFYAGPPEVLRLWYAGPMRVTVEVMGRFQDNPDGLRYRAWLTAWAGSGRVAVKYSLVNSNPDRRTAVLVARSAITLGIQNMTHKYLVGAAKPIAGTELHAGLRLDRPLPGMAPVRVLGEDGKAAWSGGGTEADRPAGWVASYECGLAGTASTALPPHTARINANSTARATRNSTLPLTRICRIFSLQIGRPQYNTKLCGFEGDRSRKSRHPVIQASSLIPFPWHFS